MEIRFDSGALIFRILDCRVATSQSRTEESENRVRNVATVFPFGETAAPENAPTSIPRVSLPVRTSQLAAVVSPTECARVLASYDIARTPLTGNSANSLPSVTSIRF